MRAGFSLLEVLVAVMVLAAVVLPVFGSLHTSLQGTERVSEESIAANHAIALLERLSQISYRKLRNVPQGTPEARLPELLAVPGALEAPTAASRFRRFVSVETVSASTTNPADPANSEWGNLKRIEVTVKWWPDYLQGKTERSLAFRALVTDDAEIF